MTALEAAQAEHTRALQVWLSSTGDAEPAALAALDQAREALTVAWDAEARRWYRNLNGRMVPWP